MGATRYAPEGLQPILKNPVLICYCNICNAPMEAYTKNLEETEFKDAYGHVLEYHYEERIVTE